MMQVRRNRRRDDAEGQRLQHNADCLNKVRGKQDNRYHAFACRGKSGLRRRGYQRKSGGREATESATENRPLGLIA